MHDIPISQVTLVFARCWKAAGIHIERGAGGQHSRWLRGYLSPPFLEQLSFRLGNQLFFLRVEDKEGRIEGSRSLHGLLSVADGCKGHACLMPMRERGGEWEAALPGWGLQDARSKKFIDHPAQITDQKIETTDWRLLDFAAQVVHEQIEKEDYELKSWQANPGVDPSVAIPGTGLSYRQKIIGNSTPVSEQEVAQPEQGVQVASIGAGIWKWLFFAAVVIVFSLAARG